MHRIIAHSGALEKVLAMESFMGLIDLFHKDGKLSVCLAIMESFARYSILFMARELG